MKAKFGKSDNAQASRARDSIMMMAAAMKKANSTDGTAVRDAFEKLGHYDGAGRVLRLQRREPYRDYQEPLCDRLREGRRSGSQEVTAMADIVPLIDVRDLTARYGHIEALRSTAPPCGSR